MFYETSEKDPAQRYSSPASSALASRAVPRRARSATSILTAWPPSAAKAPSPSSALRASRLRSSCPRRCWNRDGSRHRATVRHAADVGSFRSLLPTRVAQATPRQHAARWKAYGSPAMRSLPMPKITVRRSRQANIARGTHEDRNPQQKSAGLSHRSGTAPWTRVRAPFARSFRSTSSSRFLRSPSICQAMCGSLIPVGPNGHLATLAFAFAEVLSLADAIPTRGRGNPALAA
jgi:hypothetical protein